MIPKYRAWDEENKRFLDAEEFIIMPDGRVLVGDWMTGNDFSCGYDDQERFILMQSTGLEDKNGVEIYKGDIVRYTWDSPNDVNATEEGKRNRVSKVFWSDWRASFAVGKKSVNSYLFRYVRNGNTVEVIGNIWENPDLLEVAE